MTLSPNARLGPYEILAKLGEGGMGEVYRAADSKLRREVAIKVLPAAFTQDPERLARFEREAQLLAQLQHPNIASIFGLEESNGACALVMELVEGEDLSARIARGPLALDEALPIAQQIAEALEAAHERGIVHRDLKPANVKVAPGGTVKVLDFGLAKAMTAPDGAAKTLDASRSPTLMNSPTLTAAQGTQPGVILGTAAYMAPEQARGGAVDKRADIWAFGVLLYEMLVGRSLFAGDTVSDTLAGVLKTEVDFTRLPADTPAPLRTLLRRTLERNPRNRLHDAADARLVLDELQRGVRDEALAAAPVALPERRGAWPLLATAAAALALGVLGTLGLRSSARDPSLAGRFALVTPDGYALSRDQMPQLAISLDGRSQVVVVVDANRTSHLLLRSVDELDGRVLPDTDGAQSPFFSPDGAWIGFFQNNALVKMSTTSGQRIPLVTSASPTPARGASWGRDGFIYFAPGVNVGLSKISENGGPSAAVTALDSTRDERTHRWPQVLPDGSAVLFSCGTMASMDFYDDARIEAVRLKTGERRVLVEGASQARYGAGRKLVFARGGSLYAIAFDPVALTVSGSPEPVAQGVATDMNTGAVQFALSASGAALWAPGGHAGQRGLFWVEATGAETTVPVPPDSYSEAELSPDGKRVALVGGHGGGKDLWIHDLERGTQTRLTSGASVTDPVWTPDGSRVAYVLRGSAPGTDRPWQIAWRAADGSRNAEVLYESPKGISLSAFTLGGRQLLLSEGSEGSVAGSGDIYLLDVGGVHAKQVLLADGSLKRAALPSPDGHWLAYAASEAGTWNVYVRPLPAGEGRWQISSPSGVAPRWNRDQTAVYYRQGSTLFRVPIDTHRGFSAGKPEPLFDRVATTGSMHTYSITPDGRIFVLRSPEDRGSGRTLYLDFDFVRTLVARGRGARP